MRWFNRYNFPYSNFHDLNLDWIIREMNRLIEEWEEVKAEWEQMKLDWAEFQAEMQRLWQEYQDLMNAAWEAYKANLNEEWADYKDEMNQAWADYQADLNAQWLAYQNTLNAAWQAYQDAMNEWKDGVDQDIQDKFDEIDAKCAECQAAVEAAIETLNNLLASVQQQVTDYLNNLPYQSIIHDTTVEWLEEHGVSVSSNVKIPEDYGAVGDGVTDDSEAFEQFMTQDSDKIAMLLPNRSYKLSSSVGNPIVISGTLYGNNATLLGEIAFNGSVYIKDVNFDNLDISNNNYNKEFTNIKCNSLSINYSDNTKFDGLMISGNASQMYFISVNNSSNTKILNLDWDVTIPSGYYLIGVFNSTKVIITPVKETSSRFLEATANGGGSGTYYTTVSVYGDINKVGYPASWTGAIDADAGSLVRVGSYNIEGVEGNI